MTSAIPMGQVFPFELTGYQPSPVPLPNIKEPEVLPPPEAPYLNRAPGDTTGAGCSLTTNGEDMLERRFLMQNSPFPGDSFPNYTNKGPIYIPATNYAKTGGVTPMYGEYTPQLWETPYDEMQEKESLGIMVNSYTGEVSELFQDAMPAPNTNKAIDPRVLTNTNPMLTWKWGGGQDPNFPYQNKKEVALYMPGSDYGPNVWGDQLYAEQRRDLQTNLVMRDVFNHRNGIFPCEQAFNKELPAGYWGYQPWVRWIPYMPPTQELDIKDWVPGLSIANEVPDSGTNPLVTPVTFTNRINLTNVYHPGTAGLDIGDYVPSCNIIHKDTRRGIGGDAGQPNVDLNIGNYVILDYDPRQTSKSDLMEGAPHAMPGVFRDWGGYAEIQGQDNRDTRRQFYSDQEWMPREDPTDHLNAGQVGPGAVFFQNYRGWDSTYEAGYHPTKVFVEAGDTQARWISQTERDPRTEKAPMMGVANFTQADGFYYEAARPDVPCPRPINKFKQDSVECYINPRGEGGIYYAQ